MVPDPGKKYKRSVTAQLTKREYKAAVVRKSE